MDLNPDIQIKTAIKAMLDVVLPAVDPNNKLAQEQARLVVGMLSLATRQLPLMFRYERDELTRFIELAARLQAEAGDDAAGLQPCIAAGRDVLDRARAEPAELSAANFQLRDAIGAAIGAISARADDAGFKRMSDIVSAHAEGQLLRERSMLLLQNWEPDPQAVPSVESLISGDAARS